MSDLTYLAHHGVKGQKHGVRQWQNKDGSLTPAGRIHYGVGAARSAVKSVGTAIRKKVKPTNAELNIQIRKQKSKQLNREKRAELKRLKKGRNNTPAEKKKISDLTDDELNARITRLQKEAQLAQLEASKNISPGKKAVADALINAGSQAVKEVAKDTLTKAGKKYLGLDAKSTSDIAQEYEDKLRLKKAKDAYDDYNSTAAERAEDARLAREASRSQNRQTIIREQKAKVELYTKKSEKKKKKEKDDN